MLEIADPDQISPEYGGTGRRRADLPSIADALLVAGNPRGVNQVVDSSDQDSGSRALPQHDDGDAMVGEDDRYGGNNREKDSAVMMESGVFGDPRGGAGPAVLNRYAANLVVPVGEEEEKAGETGGWFYGSWGVFDSAWWVGGGRAGRGAATEVEAAMGEEREDESCASLDEEEVGTIVLLGGVWRESGVRVVWFGCFFIMSWMSLSGWFVGVAVTTTASPLGINTANSSF